MNWDTIDLYGIEPHLLLDKRRKVGTTIGLITSFLCVMLTLGSIYYFGKDIVFRQEPQIITTRLNTANPDEFILTKDNFHLAIGLQDYSGANFIDNQIYTARAYTETMTRTEEKGLDIVHTEIPLKRCSEVPSRILQDEFSILSLNDMYCLDQEEIKLKGEFGQPLYKNLRIDFERCKGENCKSKSEFNETLQDGYMGLFLVDSSFEPKNYSKPVPKFIKNMFTLVDPSRFRQFFLYLSTKEIISDIGFLFSHTNTVRDYSIHSFRELTINKELDIIVSFMIRLSTETFTYNRNYIKMQKIAADVGGIIRIIYLTGKVIVYFFNRPFYFNILFSSVMSKSVLLSSSNPKKVSKFTNLTQNSVSAAGMETNKRATMAGLKSLKNKGEDKVEINSLDAISLYSCCKTKKARSFDRVYSRYNEFIMKKHDLLGLIKHQNEWNSFKKLFLPETHYKILSFYGGSNNFNAYEEAAYSSGGVLEKIPGKIRIEVKEALKQVQDSEEETDKKLLEVLAI